jgi:ABC-type Na+ efflux pump permease subunit
MLLLSLGGYIGAAIDTGAPDAGWVTQLSLVPFFSPYLMLVRLMVGHVSAGEVALSIVLLVAAIAAALWLAIRVYRAGVLLRAAADAANGGGRCPGAPVARASAAAAATAARSAATGGPTWGGVAA